MEEEAENVVGDLPRGNFDIDLLARRETDHGPLLVVVLLPPVAYRASDTVFQEQGVEAVIEYGAGGMVFRLFEVDDRYERM